ncbi:hypothetical protein F66182_4172 [Fusarium sp. NRRL 66182]|nr:hypothetical protein F66182_4172 [Fusarium sp. NRRL 66182]
MSAGSGLFKVLSQDAVGSLSTLSRANVMLTAVLGLVVLFLADSLRSWHRLSHVPGPFWAGFSKAWMVRQSLKGRQPYAIQEANEKYGPSTMLRSRLIHTRLSSGNNIGSLVRIGPNELATDDPKLLRRIMASRSAYSRGPWYNALRFEPGKDNLFSMRDDDAHAKLRNKMAAGYSGKENESLERTIDEHIARLIDLIETKYLSSTQAYRPVDFAQKIQYFTLDVISDLAFGHPFGYMEQDDDVFDLSKSRAPSFLGLLPKESDKLGFGAFIGVANKKVAERFGPDATSKPDMLGSFIRHGLDQEQASRESLLNVVAGSDTSATTIRMIMLSLLSNPIAYKKLQKEIDDGIASGSISSPITDAEARRLPYLQAAIQEGLRIKAPAAGPLFKTVPKGGDHIQGRFIPEGTQIGTSPFGIYHSKHVFGQDAGLFSPERWLDADPARVEEMSGLVNLVFSSGKYQCLGKPVALIELNKIFVEASQYRGPWFLGCVRPLHIMNAGIWLIEDFPVRIIRRDNGATA